MALQERDSFNEEPVTKPASFTCRTYRHRDDSIVCRRCQRTFDIPSHQSIAHR